MCLIIDNNLIGDFIRESNGDLKFLMNQLLRGKCCMHYGGHLKTEYFRSSIVEEFILELDRAGRAIAIPDQNVNAEQAAIEGARAIRSDDPHVLALARVGKARVLCSNDEALCEDFKDKAIIDAPRGNIFRKTAHAHLLRRHC